MDKLKQTIESLLVRFLDSGSISLVEPSCRLERKKTPNKLILSIPNQDRSKEIRNAWENDRREVPRSGIVFPDGSIMTVLFQCSELPIPKPLEPIRNQIIFVRDERAFAFVERYSYCFYPNSEAAEYIGYFRYDFHSESMGEGDLGDHTYFHMHHRQVEKGFRLATGPLLEFDKIVSGIEKALSPKERKKRLWALFKAGKFEELLMDLTIDGVVRMAETLMDNREWKEFQYQERYQEFVERHT